MKSISFKYKLIISMLAMSLTPLVISSIYGLTTSRKKLEHDAFEKLVSIREAKNDSITRYLNTVSSQILTLAHNKMIIDAAKDYTSAFNKLPGASDEAKIKIRGYYTEQFAKEYKAKTSNESPLNDVTSTLSPQSLMLQHAFISNNPNPLGSKHLLNETGLLPEYSNFHKVYHPIIREYLETFALYDIFIVDIETGNIVYTVFKELDFTTNLNTGPYKDTNLAEAVNAAKNINDKTSFKIVDFKRYTPSYEAPASFIAAPIWDGDKKIAVLAFQMPLGTINEIMNERSGLGETGETYLVGADKMLRSDTHNDPQMNIFNSFNNNKLVDSTHIQEALDSKPGSSVTKNYNNTEVLSSYTKIKYPHLPWVIFADESVKEAFKSGDEMMRNIIYFIIASVVVVGLITVFITNGLSRQIEDVVESFSSSAHDVQNSSQKMDLISNKLFHSVQSQISSITQSASAMDEITAMLRNNAKSAQTVSKLSQDSKESALNGKETVKRMQSQMDDLSMSYDDIEVNLEKNNADMGRIIDVISEISKKTEVINEIVFQTKLLSFNASVEAARAGEAGKGFSVVAEEIASLADMSGKAANDISSMLKGSQDQVRSLADDSKKRISTIVVQGRGKMNESNLVAGLCNTELDRILSCVGELDSSIQEISVAIKEQANGVEEVNGAMKVLENATHQTTDLSQRSKTASVDLKKQSHSLRESIQMLRKILGAKKSYSVNKFEEKT